VTLANYLISLLKSTKDLPYIVVVGIKQGDMHHGAWQEEIAQQMSSKSHFLFLPSS
jgi:hypothetical protein